MAGGYEALCGAKEGDVISPQQTQEARYGCDAVQLVPATGLRFTHEHALPDPERSKEVTYIFQARCLRLIDEGKCPQILYENAQRSGIPPGEADEGED